MSFTIVAALIGASLTAMHTLRVIGTSFVIGAVLSVSACGSSEAEASAACLEAMEVAADATPMNGKIDLGVVEESLSTCSTADEWLAGLKRYPGVVGLPKREEQDDTSLPLICYYYQDTPVCEDYYSQSGD